MGTSLTYISGLKELDDTLKSLPTEIENKIIRGSLRAGQEVALEAAKAKLISNGNVDSGALLKSIRIRFSRNSKQYGWVRSYLRAGDKAAWYAHFIEFGTGRFYAGNGSKSKRAAYEIKPKNAKALFFSGNEKMSVIHPGIKPRPFMRPTFDATSKPAMDAIASYIRTRLPKEVKKLARIKNR